MAKGGHKVKSYLSDPVGSERIINRMPSGLLHLSDSQGSGRDGRVIIRQGSPGDPMEKSPIAEAGYMGNAPNPFRKFVNRTQK